MWKPLRWFSLLVLNRSCPVWEGNVSLCLWSSIASRAWCFHPCVNSALGSDLYHLGGLPFFPGSLTCLVSSSHHRTVKPRKVKSGNLPRAVWLLHGGSVVSLISSLIIHQRAHRIFNTSSSMNSQVFVSFLGDDMSCQGFSFYEPLLTPPLHLVLISFCLGQILPPLPCVSWMNEENVMNERMMRTWCMN